MKPVNDGIRRNSEEIKNLFKSLHLDKACLVNYWETTISDPSKHDMKVVINHIVPLDYITVYTGTRAYNPVYVNKIYYTFDVYFGYNHKDCKWNWFKYICPSMKYAKAFIYDYSDFIKHNSENDAGFKAFDTFKDKYIRLAKGHFKNWLLSLDDNKKFKVEND